MKIYEILHVLRLEHHLSQRDLYGTFFSRSVYQRIEQGKKDLTVNEIKKITEKLGVNFLEFLTLTKEDEIKEIDLLRTEIKTLIPYLNSIKVNNRLIKINELLKKRKRYNVEWFNLYIFFCLAFYQKKNYVLKPHKQDLIYLKEIYQERTYFTFIDYKVFLNCISIFGLDEMKFLEDKLFPVSDKNLRDYEFICTVFLTYNNLISICMNNNDYELGFKYFEDALEFEDNEIEYYSKIQLLYLHSLLKYQEAKALNQTKDELAYFLDAYNYADQVKNIGDKGQSRLMFDELERIKNNDSLEIPKELGIILDKPVTQLIDLKIYLK